MTVERMTVERMKRISVFTCHACIPSALYPLMRVELNTWEPQEPSTSGAESCNLVHASSDARTVSCSQL
eukprot:6246121-Pyramimonas_sp.AAC.1